MKELYFNELSLYDTGSIETSHIISLRDVYKSLRGAGITSCRIGNTEYATFLGRVRESEISRTATDFIYAFFRTPFENEGRMTEENEDDYLTHTWRYENKDCVGLAMAFIMNTAGLSLHTPKWDVPAVNILRDKECIAVNHLCRDEHVETHRVFLTESDEIQLHECEIPWNQKKIDLRDDHGKDVLYAFSRRIVQSKYVVEVINSIPYNQHERSFIRKVRDEGIVEIVLPWTDRGLGVVVKTTGRTMRETKAIAEILKERYGYR